MGNNGASPGVCRAALSVRVLVTLALILISLAAAQTAHAESADFYLSFKDGKLYENAYQDGKEYTTGKGVTWSATPDTLTLNNFSFTTLAKYGLVLGSNNLVLADGTYNTIQCVGGIGVSADNQTTALLCGNTTFSGGGSLSVTGGSPAFPSLNSVYGISGSALRFEDCSVNAICRNANDASCAIYCYSAAISGATIYANSGVGRNGSYGFYALKGFIFGGGTVTATSSRNAVGSHKNAAIYVDTSDRLNVGSAVVLTANADSVSMAGRVGSSQPPQYVNNTIVVDETGVVATAVKLIVGVSPPKPTSAPTPTPTPTPTPIPTPNATATPAPGSYALNEFVNNYQRLNIRERPSMFSNIIGKVPVGEYVTVVKYGEEWTLATFGRVTGYMSTRFLRFGTRAELNEYIAVNMDALLAVNPDYGKPGT